MLGERYNILQDWQFGYFNRIIPDIPYEIRAAFVNQVMLAESMKYAVIVIASLPVIVMYPFVQKHFVKGVMIGSIKGWL